MDESIQMYLKEISQFPLLTFGEEVEAAKTGDTEKLINSNLRLVVSIAKKFMNRGLPLMDLIQEGNVGLIEAAKKYNFEIKAKENTSYINAVGVLDFNVNKELFNIDLTKMINQTVTQLNTMHEEFKNSFPSDDLYQKYDSWYGIVTKPNILTIK